MKKLLRYLFVCFLFVYAVFIGLHTLKISWTLQNILLFSFGITLAIFAHAKKNYITILILVVHMAIEWFEWSQKKLMIGDIIFNFLHAVMDFVFLFHELEVHVKNYRKVILVSITLFLVTIFCIGHFLGGISDGFETIEPFVIGGVLGCISSHIYFHFIKE